MALTIREEQDAAAIGETFSFTLTQAQAGDLAVVFSFDDYNDLSDVLEPTGTAVDTWTLRLTFDGGTNGDHWKVWTGTCTTAGGTVDVTYGDTGTERYAAVLVTSPGDFDAASSQQGAASTSWAAPSVDATADSDVMLCAWGTAQFAGTTNLTAPASMTAYTERENDPWDTQLLASEQLTASGATGTRTAVATDALPYVGITVLLKPQASGGGNVTGTLSGFLPALSGMFTGAVPEPAPAGAVNGTLPGLTGSFTATSDAQPPPFISGASGSTFLDQDGQPIMVKGDTVWALPYNAGRWNGGDWRTAIGSYMSARGAQGYNAAEIGALGNTNSGGVADTGETWDGVLPFVNDDPGQLNNSYWERIDYILAHATAQGITIAMNVALAWDVDQAALSGRTDIEYEDYGAAVGGRYSDYPNIVWMVGADYFGYSDTAFTKILDGIRGTGDTHLISVEYYEETTSRRDLSDGSVLAWGDENAQFNWVYSYNVTYQGIESAYAETPLVPVVWGDGYYKQGGTADRRLMRNLTWWALSSGSRGTNYGSESLWSWQAAALDATTSETWATTDQPLIRDTFETLAGWHELLPDTDSSLVTSGRGAHASAIPSGGGDTSQHYTASSPQDGYVTASVTPGGTLAVIYCPVAASVTVDDTEMVAGYTATWVDPAAGTQTPATVSSSYATPGANSLGDPDWVLALQEPTGVTGQIDGTLPALAAATAGFARSDDFESGGLTGWDNVTPASTVTPDAAHTGSLGLRENRTGADAAVVSLSDATLPDGSPVAEVSFWWRQAAHSSGNSPVLTVQNRTGADHADLYVNYGADSHLWWDLVGTDNAETPGPVELGVWRRIRALVDFGSTTWTLRVWLDGTEQAPAVSVGKTPSDVRAIHFGGFASEVNTRDYDDITVRLYSALPFTGTVTAAGGIAGTLPALAGQFTGTVGSAAAGALTGVLPALTGHLDGTLTATGTLDGQLPALVGGLTGQVTAPAAPVTGTITGQLPVLTGRLTGISGDITATGRPAPTPTQLTIDTHTGTLEVDKRAGTVAIDARVGTVDVTKREGKIDLAN